MSELEETKLLANKILDRPNADPDDDLAMLSRQFLRQTEALERAKKNLRTAYDPYADLIHANQEDVLKKHEEAVRKIRPLLEADFVGAKLQVMKILDALNQYHPMHCESWCGWPEEIIRDVKNNPKIEDFPPDAAFRPPEDRRWEGLGSTGEPHPYGGD